jgi:arylsulfatase A-like enzyme
MLALRCWTVSCVISAACSIGPWSVVAGPERRPNIVVIVSDDLGYSQLGFNGYDKAATPHLDSICRRGVYFTQGYATSPLCAPSRAGLMTGRHQARYGYESQVGSVRRMTEKDTGVDTREILLPQLLKGAGYATAVVGKWHLGYNERYRPNQRGVDHFFGFLTKGRYFLDKDVRSPILRNGQEVQGQGYLTEAFAAEAVEFIRRNKERPFFLYYAPFNVHEPHVVPAEYIPPGGQTLDGMIQALDRSVGTILEALSREGLERDTLVVFVNDNGGYAESNKPFRSGKETLYEGGIRVPFAMRWPGHLPEGLRYDPPVSQLDVFPTVAAAAGARLPDDREYDGVDLLPYLGGKRSGRPHDELRWRLTDMAGRIRGYALRAGNLKIVVDAQGNAGKERAELYDLAEDVGESRDLASARPEDLRKLMQALKAWEAGVTARDGRPLSK